MKEMKSHFALLDDALIVIPCTQLFLTTVSYEIRVVFPFKKINHPAFKNLTHNLSSKFRILLFKYSILSSLLFPPIRLSESVALYMLTLGFGTILGIDAEEETLFDDKLLLLLECFLFI